MRAGWWQFKWATLRRGALLIARPTPARRILAVGRVLRRGNVAFPLRPSIEARPTHSNGRTAAGSPGSNPSSRVLRAAGWPAASMAGRSDSSRRCSHRSNPRALTSASSTRCKASAPESNGASSMSSRSASGSASSSARTCSTISGSADSESTKRRCWSGGSSRATLKIRHAVRHCSLFMIRFGHAFPAAGARSGGSIRESQRFYQTIGR